MIHKQCILHSNMQYSTLFPDKIVVLLCGCLFTSFDLGAWGSGSSTNALSIKESIITLLFFQQLYHWV